MSYNLPEVKIKGSAKINGAHFYPNMVRVINAARGTAPELIDKTVWITSGAEWAENRLENSKHYSDEAFDFRVSNIICSSEEERVKIGKRWVVRLALVLGGDYDIVWKGNHIHCEYDPETNTGV